MHHPKMMFSFLIPYSNIQSSWNRISVFYFPSFRNHVR